METIKKFTKVLFGLLVLSLTFICPQLYAADNPPGTDFTDLYCYMPEYNKNEVVINADNPPGTGFADFSTLAAIISVISLIVTQLAKQIPFIDSRKIYKCITALLVSIILCFAIWFLDISDYLRGMTWYMVLFNSLIAGGSAMGLYDIVRGLFDKDYNVNFNSDFK